MSAVRPSSLRAAGALLWVGLIAGCDASPGAGAGAGVGVANEAVTGTTTGSETGTDPEPPLGRMVLADLPTRRLEPAAAESESESEPPPRATLVRFWTDTCPFCEASLPAVESLRREFGARGLATLGVYHPKPPRAVNDEHVLAAAQRLGYHGPLAVDEQWDALQELWLRYGGRRATSFSMLLDADGVVRFVHPGPEFHPSTDPDHAACDADYRALRAAILQQLDA